MRGSVRLEIYNLRRWRSVRFRYTGAVVKFRSFAFMVALLVASAPVIGMVCALDCDRPASPPCHGASPSHDGITWQVTPHACGHEHMSASLGLLSSASVRNTVQISVAAPSLTRIFEILPEIDPMTASALHGPPGVTPRSRSSQITVLRV